MNSRLQFACAISHAAAPFTIDRNQCSRSPEYASSGRAYYEFRVAESQRGIDAAPTFFTVRVMKEDKPSLEKGDFVKVTGKLKADFYLSREGKPTGTLLVIAFEAAKISKPVRQSVEKVE